MKHILIFLFLCSTAFAQLSAVDTLVAAERAFARKSRDTNVRDAFLTYFAPDGIVFNPGPTNARQLYTQRPVPPFTLDWEPAYADVSQAGDLGFTTGPYRLTQNANRPRSPQKVTDQGTFFSVWEKQKDKTWKVMLDFGVSTDTPRALRPTTLNKGTISVFHPRPGTDSSGEARTLMAIEGALSKGQAYEQSLAPGAYVVQDGLQRLSTAARPNHLANMKSVKLWKPLGGGVAKNGDLAYTYGMYQATLIGSPKNELRQGYYARVWKRDAQGGWKIALDNTQTFHAPLPSAVTP